MQGRKEQAGLGCAAGGLELCGWSLAGPEGEGSHPLQEDEKLEIQPGVSLMNISHFFPSKIQYNNLYFFWLIDDIRGLRELLFWAQLCSELFRVLPR